ncbi:serine/threonine-protein kinase [Lentisphaera profundi]|uniref:Serine/threonine-protein kinase n=1 Tax=Lentisphaera profundi TaxID=1658616 RepID=A0ABY7VRN5_9BACT|nr:serine/threonine-protein kinase [Lentisphaera profundi]WDE96541.1 serine/threonine-protein kinase [Lentisphaera profundi]
MSEPPLNFFTEAFQEAVENPDALSSLQGNLNGRYTEQEFIAEGGLKKIYQVLDNVTGRLVAKAYPKSNKRELCDLFICEARVQSLLEHPNIIPIYDLGLDEEIPWFTMKLIRGKTLDQHLSVFAQDPEASKNDKFDIFSKICDAISYAHSQKVLHLDLKPENIFVDDYGEVLIGDWGLARFQGGQQIDIDLPLPADFLGQGSLYGCMTGTPGYMAPEQCSQGSEKTPCTDVYSLGALLHFIFAEKAVYQGDRETIIEKCIRGKYELDEDKIPLRLLPIINKCLAFESDKRYQSVSALMADINSYRLGYLTSAEEKFFWRQQSLLIRRNKKTFTLIFIFFIAIIILSSLFIYKIKQSEQRALANEMSALEQKKQSHENLLKYLDAEQGRQEAATKMAESYVVLSGNIFQDRQGNEGYDLQKDLEAYQLINTALLVTENSPQIWALKGKLAVRLERMDDAIEAFEKAGDQFNQLRDLCLTVSISSGDRIEKTIKLMRGLFKISERQLMNDLIFKIIYSDRSEDEKIEFALEAVKALNKKKTHMVFIKSSMSLDFSGNAHLKLLFPMKNLQIKHLDLSGTAVTKDFKHVTGMPLESLNMNDTGLTSKLLSNLEAHKTLKTLKIARTPLTDLSVLPSLKLIELDISGIPCRDFSPLNKCTELRTLHCSSEQKKYLENQLKGNKIKLVMTPLSHPTQR